MLSVVILSYNTHDITLECLKHLSKSKDIDLEIIVVDNASTDDSVEHIKKHFPQVKLIANKINVGFAAGNNQAMRIAKGDKILLLNSDCYVYPDTLTKLPDVDIVGCKLLNSDLTIQPSYGYFPTLRRIAQMMFFVDNFPVIRKNIDTIHVRDLFRYDKTLEVDWVMGAFILLKKEVFTKTGGFDEKYFMYGEEMEWLYRAKKIGFKIWFCPETCAIHLGGASTKSVAKMFLSEMQGYLYWFSKHNSVLEQKLLKIILILGCLIRIPAWAVWGKWDKVKAYFEVLKSLLT